MKQIKYILLLCFISSTFSLVVNAQIPGTVDTNPSVQASVNGYINSTRLEILGANNGLSADDNRILKAGTAKIKAGKATMMFVPSVKGYEDIVSNLNFDETVPPDFPGRVSWVEKYISKFNDLMLKNHLKPNDFSDGFAFAYVLSLEAYNDQKPDDVILQNARKENRQQNLNSAYFQGSPDLPKQFKYGMNALMAVQGIEWREKARAAKTAEEKKAADEKAKMFAENFIEVKK